MRPVTTVSFLAVISIAAACARGGVLEQSGSGNTGGTTGVRDTGTQPGTTTTTTHVGFTADPGTGGATGGGTGGAGTGNAGGSTATGCGLESSDAVCDGCLQAACCAEADACANDALCLTCLTSSSPPAACDTSAPTNAFYGCIETNCSAECLGGGSTGGLTCADVDNDIGCCDASGVLHYCEASGTMNDTPCGGGTVCGWDDYNGWYDCIDPPAYEDPSGAYPMACGGP